jgi:hypothetical protein
MTCLLGVSSHVASWISDHVAGTLSGWLKLMANKDLTLH